MKPRKIYICFAILLLSIILMSCVGCLNLNSSINYNKKFKETSEYSFNIIYTTSSSTVPVYISCYKKGNDYAYRFSFNGFGNKDLAYRQIFTNSIFYEICENKKTGLWMGEYKKTQDVAFDAEENFMYKYTSYITSGSYATLLAKGTDVDYRDLSCVKYSFNYEGSNYTYIFDKNSNDLLKFVMIDSEQEVTTLEYYDYVFDSIDTECLQIPNVGLDSDKVQLYKEVSKLTYEIILK